MWYSQTTTVALSQRLDIMMEAEMRYKEWLNDEVMTMKLRQKALENLIQAPTPVTVVHQAGDSPALGVEISPPSPPRLIEAKKADGGSKKENCFSLDKQKEYVSQNERIVGIIRPISAFIANVVAAAQLREGLRGGVGEIGAFQGKFTLALLLSARHEELAKGWFIADAFEELHDVGGNPAGGVGCEACFRNQITKYAGQEILGTLELYKGDNRKLRGKDIPEVITPIRIFSVDGDHSYDGTMIDICVVVKRLIPGGIIILDDIHNTDWPEVLAAWKQYVKNPAACDDYAESGAAQRLEPFAAVGNKLYATTIGVSPHPRHYWADKWSKAILDADEGITERYQLQKRKGLLKLGPNGQDGPVYEMFVPIEKGTPRAGFEAQDRELLSDELVEKGERKSSQGMPNGEPPSGAPPIHDNVLRDMHLLWLERGDNACPGTADADKPSWA